MPALPSERRSRAHPVRWILLAPFIATLWVPWYNALVPRLAGIPFYYWYQLLWVIIGAAVIAVVYFVER